MSFGSQRSGNPPGSAGLVETGGGGASGNKKDPVWLD
jgi:hypothetical protein